MVELVVRLCLIATATAAGFFLPGADSNLSLRVGLILAAATGFGYLLRLRGLRTNQVSLVLTALEIAGIAAWLASAGEITHYGFIVLAPILWAVTREDVEASAIAPISGALLIAANMLAGHLPMFAPALLVQSGIVVGIGMMLVFLPKPQPQLITKFELPDRMTAPLTVAGDDYLQIRESYRALRERFRELEIRSDRDRLVVRLFELRGLPPRSAFPRLAEVLAEVTGADAAAIYGVAQSTEALVIRGSTTDFPDELAEKALVIDPSMAHRDVRLRLDAATRAVPSAEVRDFANVLLIDEDRVVGLICVASSDAESLRLCREKAEEAAPFVALFLREEQERDRNEQRLRHSEMLYTIATLGAGATTPEALAQRVIKELSEIIPVDGLAIHGLASEADVLAAEGANLALIDSLNFDLGTGLRGWIKTGAPEVVMFDARNDERCPSDTPLRRRIGSYCQIALHGKKGPVGFLSAATHQIGGIDEFQVETIRVVAAELSRALALLDITERREEGLIPAEDFRRLVAERAGCLIVLEVLHREQIGLVYGRPAVETATRKLQTRLRAQLPPGGVLCPRPEGDYLVFLEGVAEPFAVSWANDAAATASMIGMPRLDGTGSGPLALRAKVAQIVPAHVGEISRLSA
jgi:hypothetical protein